MSIDILLNKDWQIAPSPSGDIMLTTKNDDILQTILLEAQTTEGELFTDEDFGWSLLDFKQSQIGELEQVEIEHRILTKLKKYDDILVSSINIEPSVLEDKIKIYISFRFKDEDEKRSLTLEMDRLKVEVISFD